LENVHWGEKKAIAVRTGFTKIDQAKRNTSGRKRNNHLYQTRQAAKDVAAKMGRCRIGIACCEIHWDWEAVSGHDPHITIWGQRGATRSGFRHAAQESQEKKKY